jgi:hypothetical protein
MNERKDTLNGVYSKVEGENLDAGGRLISTVGAVSKSRNGVDSKERNVGLESLGSLNGVNSNGIRGAKSLIIITVLHEDLANISNITGASPSESAMVTSYREGNMCGVEKSSSCHDQFSFSDGSDGYTNISFGCAQVESPRSLEGDKEFNCVEVYEFYKDPKSYECTHSQCE